MVNQTTAPENMTDQLFYLQNSTNYTSSDEDGSVSHPPNYNNERLRYKQTPWHTRYEQLIAYQHQYGDCNVPTRWEANRPLGKWVDKQRRLFKKSQLPQDRVDKLNDIGFAWSLGHVKNLGPSSADEANWSVRFNELKEFKQQTGHCNYPTKNGKLGRWVKTQREKYSANVLSEERIIKLESIGFVWSLVDGDRWEVHYQELVNYKAQHGDCKVPQCTNPEYKQLGKWISNQRTRYHKGLLSSEHISKLDELGFDWSDHAPWKTRYDQLVAYKEKNEKLPPTLVRWASRNRTAFRAGKLSEEKTVKLNAVGFVWNPIKKRTCKAASNKKKKKKIKLNENSDVDSKGEESTNDCFVGKTRPVANQQRSKSLPGDKESSPRKSTRTLLSHNVGEAAPKETTEPNLAKTRWEERFNELLKYKEQNGDCLVPHNHESLLGIWVSVQRRQHQQGNLSIDRFAKLTAAGFKWEARKKAAPVLNTDNGKPAVLANLESNTSTSIVHTYKSRSFDSDWKSFYPKLLSFKQKHGHCRVPLDESGDQMKLGVWVRYIRRFFGDGKLSEEQAAKLELIGFEWDVASSPRKSTTRKAASEKVSYNNDSNEKEGEKEGRKSKLANDCSGNIKQQCTDGESSEIVGKTASNEALTLPLQSENNNVGHKNKMNAAWDTRYNELVAYKKEFGDCMVPQIYKANRKLGSWVTNQRSAYKSGKLSADHRIKLKDIGFTFSVRRSKHDVKRRVLVSWDTRYNELVAYKNEFGDCMVPQHYKENRKLGSWVHHQKVAWRKGSLLADRRAKLEEIGFLTSNGQPDVSWDTRYNELIAYKNEFGDCEVPRHYDANKKLGSWVRHQRAVFRRGGLSSDRLAKLKEIGFVWSRNYSTSSWGRLFDELVAYKNEFGDCNVLKRKNEKLFAWVSNQRAFARKGKLSEDRVAKLNTIGFVWNRSGAFANEVWNTRYNELLDYKTEHGNCNVPYNYKTAQNFRLGIWGEAQRAMFKQGKLSEERITKLNEAGFSWVFGTRQEQMISRASRWDNFYKELRLFKARTGNCNVPSKNMKYLKLGPWVAKQRRLYKDGKLSDKRIAKLNNIGFEWILAEAPEKSWNERFNQLAEYREEFGHCKVPLKQNKLLGGWVLEQRRSFKRGTLSVDRVERLDAIGFVWSLRPRHSSTPVGFY